MAVWDNLLLAAFGATTIVVFIIRTLLAYWQNRGILHARPTFMLGNLRGVGSKRHLADAVQTVYDQFAQHPAEPPFVGFYVVLKPMVLVTSLDLVKSILADDAANFSERGLNCTQHPLHQNLMHLDGEEWQKLNAEIRGAFGPNELERIYQPMFHMMSSYQVSLHLHLLDKQEINVSELVSSFNTDVISAVAFGLMGSDSLRYPRTEFRSMACRTLGHFQMLHSYIAFHFPLLARLLQMRNSQEQTITTNYYTKLVTEKLGERRCGIRRRQHDFLYLFEQAMPTPICAANEDETFRRIAAQCFAFLSNGLHAMNAVMVFCLYELAQQPCIQAKVHQELAEVLRAHKDIISLECLGKMKYLKQVINETLRKYTPHPVLLRLTRHNYDIANSTLMLQAGDHVIIPVAAIHKDERWYPEPERFDPDRFLPENVARRPAMSFLPFGAGPRSCLARHFAELQIQLGLVALLEHYQFNVVESTPAKLCIDNGKLLLTPKQALRLGVERLR